MYSYEVNGRGNTSATDAKLLERKSQFINLPAVTPEDDGKVLGVNNGKWQPVDGGGGGWPSDLHLVYAGGYGWKEDNKTNIIPETQFNVTDNTDPIYGFEDFDLAGKFSTSVDFRDIYTEYLYKKNLLALYINGQKYGVSGFDDDYDSEYIEIGIASATGESIPAYLIQYYDSNNVSFYIDSDYIAPGDTTIELVAMLETVHIIEPKYLGDAGKVFVTNFIIGNENTTVDRTIEEVKQHADNGDLMVFNFTGNARIQMIGYMDGYYAHYTELTLNRSVVSYDLNFAYDNFELSYTESHFDNSENDENYVIFNI